VSADLNYTLKRLIRGLTSDNHSAKKGFYLATVLVLKRFKSDLELEKLIEFVKMETKLEGGLKNPEIHSLRMGRMMSLSAIIESGFFSTERKQSNEKKSELKGVVD
jgi:DNA polymerase phi